MAIVESLHIFSLFQFYTSELFTHLFKMCVFVLSQRKWGVGIWCSDQGNSWNICLMYHSDWLEYWLFCSQSTLPLRHTLEGLVNYIGTATKMGNHCTWLVPSLPLLTFGKWTRRKMHCIYSAILSFAAKRMELDDIMVS